jgi:hypothetical protein
VSNLDKRGELVNADIGEPLAALKSVGGEDPGPLDLID